MEPTFSEEEIDSMKSSMSEEGTDGEIYDKPERL
jgi:hypothetical protein